jgi:uncharacterized membrane protein YraQ (UPF0718 family)
MAGEHHLYDCVSHLEQTDYMATTPETINAQPAEVSQPPRSPGRWEQSWPTVLLLVALALWGLVYTRLALFADWYTYTALLYPRAPGSTPADLATCCGETDLAGVQMSTAMRQGRAVAFLLFQVPHVFLLLALVIFLMGIVRSFFSAERTRALLVGQHPGRGTAFAAALGVLTPFCSCSAVPLFVGFLTAGVPLGVTITFLATAPLVNEVALSLLYELFGWKIAGAYLLAGITIAMLTGWLIGRARLERFVEPWVYTMIAQHAQVDETPLTWNDRLQAGLTALRDILGKVWFFVLLGVAAGAIIHAYVSRDALLGLLGQRHWWSVPLAVAVGVPMYANPAGIIPIVQALFAKGVPLGTVLAFMMATVGLSLPEALILRRVLRPPLLAIFFGALTVGIILVGLLLNLVPLTVR